ncbi:MAG: GNAT family N-acetyltransferase [Candidatus Saccharibacteria bacterium]
MITLRKVTDSDVNYFSIWWRDSDLIGLTSGDFGVLDDKTVTSYFKSLISSASNLHNMILLDGKPIGHISLQHTSDNWWELQIIIADPSARGRGYGPEAITRLLDITSRQSLVNIFLNVRPDNTRAVQAYEKVGFYKVGDVFETANGNLPSLIRMELSLD